MKDGKKITPEERLKKLKAQAEENNKRILGALLKLELLHLVISDKIFMGAECFDVLGNRNN